MSPENPTFNTANTDPVPGHGTITFNHQQYRATLPGGAVDGFQILTINDALGVSSEALPTNGPGDVAAQQATLARVLKYASQSDGVGGAVLIIQSIGHPTPRTGAWGEAADWIEKLGGNRLGFTSLNTSSDYRLVGSLTAGAAAVEANSVLDKPGPLAGSLARDRNMVFQPVSGGAPGGVNTELIDISYQAPRAFPAYNATSGTAAGTAAAEVWIGQHLGICATDVPTCSMRQKYYTYFTADWHQASVDLNATKMDYPGDGHGFDAVDYAAVRNQLSTEISALNRVRTYFDALQKPFGEAAQQGTIDLDDISNAVFQAVGTGSGSKTTSYTLGLIGKIVALGAFLPPPANGIAAGMSAGFALGAYLSQPSGEPQLGTDVGIEAGKLGKQLRAQMLATSRSMTGLNMLVISDYGKLMDTNAKLPTAAWQLPSNTGPSLESMTLASKRWFAEQLVPLVFPWLIRGTPQLRAQDISCEYQGFLGILTRQIHPWENQPANAQILVPENFYPDGTSYKAALFFAKPTLLANPAPPASLSNMLFDPANPITKTLGLNKIDFISPRVFGTAHHANDTAWHCDLGISGPPPMAIGSTPNAAVGVAGVVLYASVHPAFGAGTGTVSFSDNGAAVPGCAARPVVSGVSTCVTSFATAGERTISATYTGDGGSQSAAWPLTVSANPEPMQIAWGWLIAFAHDHGLLGL